MPRVGIRTTNARIAFQPRPKRWGIRQFFFELEPLYITNLENRLENWRFFIAPFDVRIESGEHLEWYVIPEFEHLDAPFEIYPGVILPVGSYQWHRYRAEVNTATKRWWVLDFVYWWGGFYDGTRKQTGLGVTLKPNAHLSLVVRADRNDIVLREGRFYTQAVTTRADYNFTPNVSWQNLLQYDNESQLFSFQSRFRWILKPGNDLFVVVNRGWVKTFDGSFESSFDRASSSCDTLFDSSGRHRRAHGERRMNFSLRSLGFTAAATLWAATASAQLHPSLCADCHLANGEKPNPTHFQEWEHSAHERANVGCEACHGGNSNTVDSFLAHQSIIRGFGTRQPAAPEQPAADVRPLSQRAVRGVPEESALRAAPQWQSGRADVFHLSRAGGCSSPEPEGPREPVQFLPWSRQKI